MSSSVGAKTGTIQTTASGTSYITGTISGFNTQALIDNAVNAKLVPKARLQDQIATNSNIISAYQDVQNLAQKLQDSLNVLKSTTTGTATNVLTSKQTTYLSSDSTTPTNILTATTTASAQPGSHKVIVTQIAEALTVTSAEQTTATTGLGYTGTFDIGETGKTASTITVTATTTLQDIADAINTTTATSGVKADILQAADGKFKLVISGNDTATAVNITNVTGTDVLTNIGMTNASHNFINIPQPAQQAQFSVDGTTIYSDTNKITNVLGGLTFNLTNAAPSTTITVTVGNNVDGARTAIEEFVSTYNKLHLALATYQQIGADGTVPATSYLYNDSLTSTLFRSFSAMVTDNYGSGTVYQSLASMGLTIDANNSLVIDPTTLSTALNNNFSDVQSIFATQGSVAGLGDTFYNMLNGYTAPATGAIAKAVNALQAIDNDLAAKASDIQTQADAYRQTLIEKYAKMETAMQQANLLSRQVKAILAGSNSNNDN